MSDLNLRFSPTVWAKLRYLCTIGNTEIGGFGISDSADPLYIVDFELVKQVCTAVSIQFDDESIATYFVRKAEQGLQPQDFARVWIHTHPGTSPSPSGTDEESFKRWFGKCDWAVMFIMARDASAYCRMSLSHHVAGALEVSMKSTVDFTGRDFSGSDLAGWKKEYEANVSEPVAVIPPTNEQGFVIFDHADRSWYHRWMESTSPAEQQALLEEEEQTRFTDPDPMDPGAVNRFLAAQEKKKESLVIVPKKPLLKKIQTSGNAAGKGKRYHFLDKKLMSRLDRLSAEDADILLGEMEQYKGLVP